MLGLISAAHGASFTLLALGLRWINVAAPQGLNQTHVKSSRLVSARSKRDSRRSPIAFSARDAARAALDPKLETAFNWRRRAARIGPDSVPV